jgi:hypothetical protein
MAHVQVITTRIIDLFINSYISRHYKYDRYVYGSYSNLYYDHYISSLFDSIVSYNIARTIATFTAHIAAVIMTRKIPISIAQTKSYIMIRIIACNNRYYDG